MTTNSYSCSKVAKSPSHAGATFPRMWIGEENESFSYPDIALNTMATTNSATSTEEQDKLLLPAGSRVRIVSLAAASDKRYNNKTGVIRSFIVDTGRYQVELESKKLLGVKLEKLIVLCNNSTGKSCGRSIATADAFSNACLRCSLPYCSAECCDADRTAHHKAVCIPTNLAPPPDAPVGMADTGDAVMEACRTYLLQALQAGNEGRIAEEVAMLEALVAKDDKQFSAFFNLFRRSKDNDTGKAFTYLEKAVTLMVDPNWVLASDPQSVDNFPVEAAPSLLVAPTVSSAIGHLINCGVEFIETHRVVGRAEEQLEPDAALLENLVLLAEQVDTTDLDNYGRSGLHLSLGNVYRKMAHYSDRAIHHLTRADEVLRPEKVHNFDALILIPEIIMYQASKMTMNSNEQKEMIQKAVDMSRSLLHSVKAEEPEEAYDFEIQLACLLHNQCCLGPSERTQDKMREIIELATRGYHKAVENGIMQRAEKALGILNSYSPKEVHS